MSDPLSAEDLDLLETLFERAADLPPAERAAFADRECGTRSALRAALARLLRGLAGEDHLARIQRDPPNRSGTEVGPYRLLDQIGEGGMGEVYLAEQQAPVVRRVALKVIKRGMDSAQVVARFEAERQALARMRHPQIAQVFDGGTTAEGRPYFVMEYVAGESIGEYCDRRALSTRARIELLTGVCEGVQHAHQKGIVHRDLKPSNLLVEEHDGRATPKIIDFGVARAMTGRLAKRTLHTMAGQIVGTLDYMSPEQADPSSADIDTRSDIYSLGVVLYQLVSGHLPFESPADGELRLSEVQHAIREIDAPTPSARFRRQTDTAPAIAERRGTDERSLVRQLAGDLDWICLKALEKEPARRYASASELADDLRRHLAHEPVLAGRPGTLYRARKFVRRNRVAVAAGTAVAIATITAFVGILAGRIEARANERLARAALDAEHLSRLEREADDLWPPHPEMIRPLEEWLERCEEVMSRLGPHRARRDELHRFAALPTQPGVSRFPTAAAEWEYASLVSAIDTMEHFSTHLVSPDGISAEYGWSVPKRLQEAYEREAEMRSDDEFSAAWSRALREVPHVHLDLDGDGVTEPVYGSLDLKPQVGLWPLGPDPNSGLLEFAHLATGERAERSENGELVVTENTGLVLVLIPAGSFWMGSVEHGPIHMVWLTRPYFLSKYEMTQGQWLRVTGTNPSAFRVDGGTRPVECVNRPLCNGALRQMGFQLPTEAQWEYACRAGDVTPQPAANITSTEGYDDGFAWTAPVGSLAANGFGIHEMLGNVWEWCQDGYTQYFYENCALRDPVRSPEGLPVGVGRGGCWKWPLVDPGHRQGPLVSSGGYCGGVRPARVVTGLD